jgi:hypothetical protein
MFKKNTPIPSSAQKKNVLPSPTLPGKCDTHSHTHKYDSGNNLLTFCGLHQGKLEDKVIYCSTTVGKYCNISLCGVKMLQSLLNPNKVHPVVTDKQCMKQHWMHIESMCSRKVHSIPLKMGILYLVLLRKFNDRSLDGADTITSEIIKNLGRETLMERD